MVSKAQATKGGWLQKVLITAFVAILVLLPFHAFFSTWGGTSIGPLFVWKGWKEILLVLLVPLVAWYCVLRPDIAKLIWKNWLNRLLLLYVVLNVIFATLSHASSEAVFAGLLMNLRFLAMFVLAQVILVADHPWLAVVKKWLPGWLLVTTIVLSVMAIAQVSFVSPDFLVQFGYNKDATIAPYLVVDQNPEALRAFATMRGPNPFGSYLLLPLALALVIVIRERRNVLAGLALGLGSAALVLTSARSAWLGALAGLVVLAVVMVPRDKLIKAVKWGTVPAIVAFAGFLWLATVVPQLRLAVFHSRPDRATLTEGSSDKHWQETVNGLKDAAAHPLGQGVGTAGPASFYNRNDPPKVPENYFVQLAQELGFAGAILFIAINCMVAFQLWRRRKDMLAKVLLASFTGITVVNFFLHGWADDPTAMTWWGVVGLYLFTDKTKR
jgi:hypothetical protein